MHPDLVIDADGHCNEPWEDLTPWMPKEYHQRAPVGFTDRHGTSRMYVEGRLSTRTEGLGPGVSGPFAPHIKGGRPGERDARQRLPDMDQDGVVGAMLPVNVYGINLGDRRFDPIYELAEAAGLPLAVHPQTGHDGQYGV